MTKNSIALNRTLFLEDNLPVLRGLDSESVDLIATDPPFNKGQGSFEGVTKFGTHSYKDVWNWNSDIHDEWVSWLRQERPNLFNMILATNSALGAGGNKSGSGMGAYLCWMAVRVLEMHRVLKPTGSLYLHCDPTASHYLKAMMDAIFGYDNFRNEIVWQRQNSNNAVKKKYGAIIDYILFYVKEDNATWNQVYHERSEVELRRYRRDENGRLYKTSGLTAPAPTPNRMFTWRGTTSKTGWRYSLERLEELWAAGRIQTTKDGRPRLDGHILYLDEAAPGQKAQSLWNDIPRIGNTSKERTGWKTQKPLALYKRMIEASSNPGDMVLDPFAGCATTCVAAEQLGRQWIAVDVDEKAEEVVRERLQREVSESMAWDRVVRVTEDPPERTDDGEPAAPELILVSPRAKGRRKPVAQVREELMVRDGKRCQGCGWKPQYEDYLQVDHKKPRSLGGVDEMDNYALLCDPCNRMKSNKMTLVQLRQARADEGRMDESWFDEIKWGQQ